MNVDKKSLTDKLVELLPEKAIANFREIESISHEMAKQNMGYSHSPYQVYIATQCFSESRKVVPMILGPGQGKSMICYLLAKKHAELGDEVCIVVHSGPALTAYEELLGAYGNESITVA